MAGDLVTSLGQIRKHASPFGIGLKIAPHRKERCANTVASEEVAEPRKRPSQNGVAGGLGRRLTQGMDAVVALDSVEVDGH
jgi:hypothetical protein